MSNDRSKDAFGHFVSDDATEAEKRILRMDETAAKLLDLIAAEATTEMQKGRLFAQVLAWYKIRPTLVPSGEGGKLKEMADHVKSKGGRGNGNHGRGAGGASKSGRAIQAIIRQLPRFGGESANARVAGGDPSGSERSGGGAAGDGRELRADGVGDVPGAGDEHGNSRVV